MTFPISKANSPERVVVLFVDAWMRGDRKGMSQLYRLDRAIAGLVGPDEIVQVVMIPTQNLHHPKVLITARWKHFRYERDIVFTIRLSTDDESSWEIEKVQIHQHIKIITT